MSYPLSFHLRSKQVLDLKQSQRLMVLPQMQQALHFLNLPLLELSVAVRAEVEQNPVLDYAMEIEHEEEDLRELEQEMREDKEDEDIPLERDLTFDDQDFQIMKQLDEEFKEHFAESGNYSASRTREDEKRKAYLESLVSKEESLFEHLMEQAQETFEKPEDLSLAEEIIGNIDDKGCLQTPTEEIAAMNQVDEERVKALLKKIQSFEPYGVGARSVQESLLIQLEHLGKKESLAYVIVSQYYDDLLHHRIEAIQKGVGKDITEITKAIEEDIGALDLHPGSGYSCFQAQHIVPDVFVVKEGERLIAQVNQEFLPSLRIHSRYLKMLEDENLSMEEKEFIRKKVLSAKWLFRNLFQRNETLLRITEFLANKQKEFLTNAEGKLLPLTMKEVAEALEVHESTVARAVANKYLNGPKGLFPMKHFFRGGYVTEGGEDISSHTVEEALKKILENEDKQYPLSDAKISSLLKERGIPCARRTIAKYRKKLNMGNARERRSLLYTHPS